MCNSCLNCSDITIPTGSQGPTGPQGPAGANGTNGVDGTSVLHNDISTSTTTGTSLETLKSYTLPANTLDTDGSYIKIYVRFNTTTSNPTTSTKRVYIYFNGSFITLSLFNSIDNLTTVEHEVIISRYSNTSGRSKYRVEGSDNSSYKIYGAISSPFSTLGGLNFTTTAYDIEVKADSDVIGDLNCENLTIVKYKK